MYFSPWQLWSNLWCVISRLYYYNYFTNVFIISIIIIVIITIWCYALLSLVFSVRELMFMLAICRPSVCRLSVCLSSVTFVHPTQPIEIFGNVSAPFGTLAICDLSIKILRRLSQGNPSGEGLNQRVAAKYSDFRTFQGYISETVQDRS